MCLALPAEILSIDGDTAIADADGVELPVSLAFLDDIAPGDYVVIHVGYALTKIDQQEAEAQLAAMRAAPGPSSLPPCQDTNTEPARVEAMT